MKKFLFIFIACFTIISIGASAQNKHSMTTIYPTYKGLVMAGYQGWFTDEGDGAERGWHHCEKGGKFEPGLCSIDFRPDVSEYEKTYKTGFKLADSPDAYIFSSCDESTTDTHFKWMKEYGIDGEKGYSAELPLRIK